MARIGRPKGTLPNGCTGCGEDGPYYSRGLCRICYFKDYRAKNREQIQNLTQAWKKRTPNFRERYKEWERTYNAWYYRENKEVENARSRMYYWANKKRLNEESRAWGRVNPERVRLIAAQKRARKHQLPDTLTSDEEIELRAIALVLYPGEELHLDHIVPISKGGGTTRANCHFIPSKANISKGNKLPEEIYEQCQIPL